MPFRNAAERVATLRARKVQRIRDIIRPDLPNEPGSDNVFDFLNPAIRQSFGVIDTTNVSSNDYDGPSMALIDRFADGLILDCGAGSRPIYYDNVVNYEIVKYLSTDVVGVAEVLPFADDSFDVVFSFAVLEHVKQPFPRPPARSVAFSNPAAFCVSWSPFCSRCTGFHRISST